MEKALEDGRGHDVETTTTNTNEKEETTADGIKLQALETLEREYINEFAQSLSQFYDYKRRTDTYTS